MESDRAWQRAMKLDKTDFGEGENTTEFIGNQKHHKKKTQGICNRCNALSLIRFRNLLTLARHREYNRNRRTLPAPLHDLNASINNYSILSRRAHTSGYHSNNFCTSSCHHSQDCFSALWLLLETLHPPLHFIQNYHLLVNIMYSITIKLIPL